MQKLHRFSLTPSTSSGFCGTRSAAVKLKNLFSIQVFRQQYSSTEGCEIVLLTDGEDSTISYCFSEVEKSGSVIHTIALGPDAATELEMLPNMTGKYTNRTLKYYKTYFCAKQWWLVPPKECDTSPIQPVNTCS